jgi:hypothetical protein
VLCSTAQLPHWMCAEGGTVPTTLSTDGLLPYYVKCNAKTVGFDATGRNETGEPDGLRLFVKDFLLKYNRRSSQ